MEERNCACCGVRLTDDYVLTANDEMICDDCAENEYTRCECCNNLVYNSDIYGEDYDHILCHTCYEEYYTNCDECGDLIDRDNAYVLDDYYYCAHCYHQKTHIIHSYSYKPQPVFYGKGKRFFGVELEIDKGGKDNDNAQELLDIANHGSEKRIYIKSDGSLDNGMEIVTHPMTIEYHLDEFNWEDILKTAIHLGYRSHQTSTCGLHIHVNRDAFGETEEEQEDVISRILYFVENHWNELVKFSRRTEVSLNRWATRFGYEPTPFQVMTKAKGCYGRYYAVNLCNAKTIEFRLFRGTLKLNTLLATLQMVDKICETAMNLDDDDVTEMSWSEFMSYITEPRLIQYLKERRLYINEEISNEEEI